MIIFIIREVMYNSLYIAGGFMSKKNVEEEWGVLTLNELCSRLKLGRGAVVHLAKEKQIPSIRTSDSPRSEWRFYWPAVVKALSGEGGGE